MSQCRVKNQIYFNKKFNTTKLEISLTQRVHTEDRACVEPYHTKKFNRIWYAYLEVPITRIDDWSTVG